MNYQESMVNGLSAHAGMLKTACDAYKDGYFEEKFVLVSQMDCRSISREDFFKATAR